MATAESSITSSDARANTRTMPYSVTRGAQFYRPELDALRFMAFMSVFFCHALPFDDARHTHADRAWQWMQDVREAGNFGVCLFFLLSSYLITELLRREYLQTKSVHLKAFYLRRILRIWPLYLSILFFVGGVGVFVRPLHMPAPQFLAYLLFVGNWYAILSPAIYNPLNWLWSISVEEQFYIVWPTMAKLGGMRVITIGSLVCLPMSLLAIGLVERFQQHLEVTLWLNGLVQFQFFAWGALLAVLLSGTTPTLSTIDRTALVAAGGACWLAASGICLLKRPGVDPGLMKVCVGYELVAAGCVCFFMSALGASVSGVPKFVIYLGKISYGLYVFHGLALSAMTALRQHIEQRLSLHGGVAASLFVADRISGLGITIAVGMLSYKFLERPFLNLKSRFTFVRSRPV